MFDYYLEFNLIVYCKIYSCEIIFINIKINLRFILRIRKILCEVIMDIIGFLNWVFFFWSRIELNYSCVFVINFCKIF